MTQIILMGSDPLTILCGNLIHYSVVLLYNNELDMTKTRNGLGKRASKRTGKNLPENVFWSQKFIV